MLSVRTHAAVAALSLAFAAPSPAMAADDGEKCEGFNRLLCMPMAAAASVAGAAADAAAGVVEAVNFKKPSSKVVDATDEGDLARIKRFDHRKDPSFAPENMLGVAVTTYLTKPDPAKDAKRFAVLEYLVGKADISGELGTVLLQETVNNAYFTRNAPQESWPRRLALAHLLVKQGASARGINLSTCDYCETDNEFLALLIQSGANPNVQSTSYSALLNRFIRKDQFDAAKRLVALGADPNGSTWGKRSMLVRLVSECDQDMTRKLVSPERFEAEWQKCVSAVTTRVSFAIEQGADPNGKASPDNECLTPYEVALEKKNEELAQRLVKLGARPGFGQICRSGG
ncbi:ankyrin repeat domain-containing protein [Pseudoduganella sp. HUAS MS19]